MIAQIEPVQDIRIYSLWKMPITYM